MKIVLAVEGMDGAGKSSLARFMESLCEQNGQLCTRIGRRTGNVTPGIARITEILNEEGPQLIPYTSVFLRLAREYQRAHLAAAAPPGVVVLDRFVLSILALARLNGQNPDLLFPFLKEIFGRANIHATIFVRCPFDLAWTRVQRRNKGRPLMRGWSEPLLSRMGGFMEEDFLRGELTGQQWEIDNSSSLEEAQKQLENYLLPHLQVAQKEQLEASAEVSTGG
jgi:thymidylate kinase